MNTIEGDVPLISFLPRNLVQMSMQHGFTPSPTCVKFRGAILLVDISGFTKLSKILSKQGAWGLEQIRGHLNSFYSKIISITDSHGGDVVKIAGDALLVVFRVEDQFEEVILNMMSSGAQGDSKDKLKYLHPNATDAVAKCVKCALECVDLSKSYELSKAPLNKSQLVKQPATEKTENKLTLHCGIAYGTLFDVICGGENGLFEYLITGHSVFQKLSMCVGNSRSGEVSADPSVYDILSSYEEWRTSFEFTPDESSSGQRFYHVTRRNALKRPKELTDTAQGGSFSNSSTKKQLNETQSKIALKFWMTSIGYVSRKNTLFPFLTTIVQKRIEQDETRLGSELRNCCIVFIGLHSISFQSEESLGAVQACITVIQRRCNYHHGYLRQFLVDDKGCVAILVFGAPGHTHNDDPVRASICALEIHKELSEQGFEASIGCSKGQVFCGDVGDISRREYAFVGDTVNTAAHLMTLKKGVLCTTLISESSAHRVQFNALEPVKIKGHEKLVEVSTPIGLFDMELEDSEEIINIDLPTEKNKDDILFREKQMETVQKFIEAMDKSTASHHTTSFHKKAIFITGKHGCGKRTILDVVSRAAESSGFHIVRVMSHFNASSTFSVIVDIMDQIIGIEPYFTPEERNEAYDMCIMEIINYVSMKERAATKKKINVNEESITSLAGNQTPQAPDDYLKCYALLNSVLNIKIPTKTELSIRSQRMKNMIMRHLLVDLVMKVCNDSKILILVRNMERMSKQTIEFFRDLCATHHRVFLCMTYDETSNEDSWASQIFKSSPFVWHVDLPTFTKEQVREYAMVHCHGISVVDSFVDALYQKTEGVPGYLQDAIRLLLRYKHQLIGRANSTRNASFHGSVTSENLEGMFASEVDKIGIKVLNVLKIASTIGIYFMETDLVKICEKQDCKMKGDELELGIENDVITMVSNSPKVYMFKSKMFHQGVYNMIPLSQARRIHQDYASHLEITYPDKLAFLADVISQHYLIAQNYSKAFDFAMKSAQLHLSDGNVDYCLKMTDVCIKSMESYTGHDKNLKLGQVHRQRGILHHMKGDFQTSLGWYFCVTNFISRYIKSSLELFGLRTELNIGIPRLIIMKKKLGLTSMYLRHRFRRPAQRNQIVPLSNAGVPMIQSNRPPIPGRVVNFAEVEKQPTVTMRILFLLPDESNMNYIKLSSLVQLSDSYGSLGDVDHSLAYLIKSHEGSMIMQYFDIKLGSLVKIANLMLNTSNKKYASFVLEKVKEILAQLQTNITSSMMVDGEEGILTLISHLIVSGQLDAAQDLCVLSKNALVMTLSPIADIKLTIISSFGQWRTGLINIGIQQIRQALDAYVGLQSVMEYSLMWTCVATFNYMLGHGDRDDIIDKLSSMAINSFPSRKDESVILQSTHLAVLSGLLGFPLFLYEILDVLEGNIVASFELILLIDLVVVSLLSFVDSSSSPVFAKEKIMHSEIFRQRKEICARCLCVEATERDLFEVDNEFIFTKVNSLLDKAARIVGQLEFGASEIMRLGAYMKFMSGDTAGALDLFRKVMRITKSMGDSYGMICTLVAMENLIPEQSVATRQSYPDPSDLMKQIGSRETLEQMQKRRFLF